MGPGEELRRAEVAPIAAPPRPGPALAWLAVWMLRVAAALILSLPVLLLALWLA